MLPVVLFLGMRPSPLPNIAYLQTLLLHKWISRLVVLAGLTHGVAYLAVFVAHGTVSHAFKFDNVLGIIALCLMLVMGISSLKPLRRRFYAAFYYIHYPFAWLTVVLGCFHARPGVNVLTFWCILVLASQIVYRVLSSKKIQIEEYSITPTLKIITLPRHVLPDYFHIGSHIRLSRPLSSPWTWITPSHPYTIASQPSDDDVKLLVRECSFKLADNSEYSLIGPFPTVDSALFNTARKVLIFAGGSGLSFGAAVYRGLQMNANAEVKLVWLIKNKAELPALELLQVEEASVYVTGRLRAQGETLDGSEYHLELEDLLDEEAEGDHVFKMTEDEDDEAENHGESSESSNSTLISGTSEFTPKLEPSRIKLHKGRPDLRTEATEFFLETDINDPGTWVIACGPEGLVKEVGNWAKKHSNIQFHGEKYVM